MAPLSFTNLFLVTAIAVATPLLIGVLPRVPLPALVLELVAGIVLGPSGLDVIRPDAPVQVLSAVGLAMLLFLAGLEIDVHRLRGRLLRRSAASFGTSFAIALLAGGALRAAGLVHDGVFAAIVLSATALGVVAPVLQDAGEIDGDFGQLVVGAASIADIGTVLLLSALFSTNANGVGPQLVLVGIFAVTVAAAVLLALRAERLSSLGRLLVRLQDTTAQLRVRISGMVLIGLVALAARLGLEVILGAFAAGVVVTVVDQDPDRTHVAFRAKLGAVGDGVFIPVFFVASGLDYDLPALTSSAAAMVEVPLFVALLLLVPGTPALLYRRDLGTRRSVVAGLLLSTSLPFVIAATEIGRQLNLVSAPTAAAMVAAGLISVLCFPLLGLTLLREASPAPRS